VHALSRCPKQEPDLLRGSRRGAVLRSPSPSDRAMRRAANSFTTPPARMFIGSHSRPRQQRLSGLRDQGGRTWNCRGQSPGGHGFLLVRQRRNSAVPARWLPGCPNQDCPLRSR
jgi:hypothetical protein